MGYSQIKIIATNKRVLRNYTIIKTYEAGIALKGCEVKSLRNNNCNLKGAFVVFTNERPFLINMYINRYRHAHSKWSALEEDRSRALLLHKKQILNLKLARKLENATILPIKIYFLNNKKVKVEIGLAKAIAKKDKRNLIKLKEANEELQRYKNIFV